MSIESRLLPYLGDVNHLTDKSSTGGKDDYVHPALRNLGAISIVLVREIVAPTVFRNTEQEMTKATLINQEDVVRAVPNKWKFKERGNGLRVLRRYGVGGAYPQNRNAAKEKSPLSEVFDMNALVFGESINYGSSVLPVKAAVSYSDGLSLLPYADCVGSTTHNRASEDGSLFDASAKKNSTALFERHYVKPGTLLVQVVSTVGRTLPYEGLEHLLLCIGLGGAYGGQTSISGVNVRTHIAGIYASKIERPETSPYVIADNLMAQSVDGADVDAVIAAIHTFVGDKHEVVVERQDAETLRDNLLAELTGDSERLEQSYRASSKLIGSMFQAWFQSAK